MYTPPRTAHPTGQAPQPRHVVTCVWFWAWAAVGALATASLDLGLLTAIPALLLGVFVVRVGDRRGRSTPGFVTGAGLPLLWVAYVQREGPGTVCWHTATGTGCNQYLNPLPWLIIGIALVLTGLIAETRHNG